MKKFIVSVFCGSLVGIVFACIFIVVVPKLPDFFEKIFFTPIADVPARLKQDVKNMFAISTDQYFIESIDRQIPIDKKVVYADLGTMKISMYEHGEIIKEFPIRSIGREGTAWQTPLGKFDMSYKIKNHFSSIGHVYMPFSMHFFGNYFIHGWPYYENGKPVAEGYSGGCIRLNTPDAEEIYDFVDKGTELIVTTSAGQIITQQNFEYQLKSEAPVVDSNYLIADLKTGEVVAVQNSKEKITIGSFSKLMTALISLESLNQYQQTVLRQDIVTIADIVYPLLLGDDNDAGQLLYEHKNKAQYLIDMNTRAQSLGMNDTLYKDVNGTSSSTVSTLEDSFRLLQYFSTYKPFVLKVLSQKEYIVSKIKSESINPLKNTDGFAGGFVDISNTEALTLLNVDIENQTKTFAIFAEGNAHADADTLQLYRWLKENVVLKK